MRKNDGYWYYKESRQAPVAILMIIFKIIRSLIRTWWPFLLIFFFQSDLLSRSNGVKLATVVTISVIIFSIVRYFKFYFHLSDEKLHVQKGVFRRTRLDIPFDRIQTISFEQNIIHQLFNVVRLKIDTAGSSKEEFDFAALERSKAEEIRTFILKRKRLESPDSGDEVIADSSQLLITHSISDLIKIGVSQNHLRTAGIILAFFLGLRDRISDALGDKYVDQFDLITDRIINNILIYGLGLFVALIIFSFFGTLIYTILRYYNLHLWKTSDGYKVESGLFNKRQSAIRDQKIQMFRWVSNPVRRLFKIVQLRFYQASSAAGSRKTSITIPGVPQYRLDEFLTLYFGPLNRKTLKSYSIHRSFFFRRFLFIGVLPALLIIASGIYSKSHTWLLGILWVLLVGVYQHFLQRKWFYQVCNQTLLMSYGVIEQKNKALQIYKVQALNIRQTPYQRRKNLASITIHTASGDVKIPYIDYQLAKRLKNYALYRIESSRQKWM